MTLLKTVI